MILPADDLEPSLSKFLFNLIGRHFMMLSRCIPRTLFDRVRLAIDYNQPSAGNQRPEHVNKNRPGNS